MWLIIGYGSWTGILVNMIVVGEFRYIYDIIVWVGVMFQYCTIGLAVGTVRNVRILTVLGFFVMINSCVVLPLMIYDSNIQYNVLYVVVITLIIISLLVVTYNGMIFRRMLRVTNINTIYKCISCSWIGSSVLQCPECGFNVACIGCIHKNCKGDVCDYDK